MRSLARALLVVSILGAVCFAGDARAIGLTDCSVTKTDNVATAFAGGSVVYTIEVANGGAKVTGTANASLTDNFPAACTSVSYTSVAHGGAFGNTASGSGNIQESSLIMPIDSGVTYTATCSISGFATGSLSNTVTVQDTQIDLDPNNDSATDTDSRAASPDAVLVDGCSDGKACEWSTLVPSPASWTKGLVDGCEVGTDCGGGQCPDC